LCVERKDGTARWEQLADLKESNPVEVADYDVSKNLHDAPDFFGGFHMFSRIAAASLRLSPRDTTRGPTTFGLKSLRAGMTASDWTK
jgi:hypothetical protein